jgi:hypothetical protein
VHQAIESIPSGAELLEQRRDFGIVRNVAAEDQIRSELGREFPHPVFDALALVCERKRGAFAAACASNAIRDGAVAEHAGD